MSAPGSSRATPLVAGRPARLAWGTDWHLPQATPETQAAFLEHLTTITADLLLFAGDLSHGTLVRDQWAAITTSMPCLALLGNHDRWDADYDALRTDLRALTAASRLPGREVDSLGAFTYLSEREAPVWVTDSTAVIGHDGWYDGRAGVGFDTRARIKDTQYIPALLGLTVSQQWSLYERWAMDATDAIVARATAAFAAGAAHVLCVTHVPPFEIVAGHGGRIGSAETMPFYVNVTLGEALLDLMAGPGAGRSMHVLCGHTHDGIDAVITPSLRVSVGTSVKGAPALQPTLIVP